MLTDIKVRGEAKRGKLSPHNCFRAVHQSSSAHDVVILLVAMILMVTYVPAIPMGSIWFTIEGLRVRASPENVAAPHREE